MLALGVPAACSSDGHMFAASRSRLNYYRIFGSFYKDEFDKMLCKLDSSEFTQRSNKSNQRVIRGIKTRKMNRGCDLSSSLSSAAGRYFH